MSAAYKCDICGALSTARFYPEETLHLVVDEHNVSVDLKITYLHGRMVKIGDLCGLCIGKVWQAAGAELG